MNCYRVLLSSDLPQWRKNLGAVLNGNTSFEVIGSVSGADLIATAESTCPDLVLWKVDDEDPVAGVRELTSRCPFTLPVILVRDPKQVDLIGLIQAGARGCLPVQVLSRQIVNTLELIVNSGMTCLPGLEPGCFDGSRSRWKSVLLCPLTRREREIFSLLAKNCSNQEIAGALYLSESTVKTHIRSIFHKLHVKSRAEVFALALRGGFRDSDRDEDPARVV